MSEFVVRGVTLALYQYEAVSEAIRQAGDFYEAGLLDELRRRRPTEKAIVDVGANIGNHSAYWGAFVPHERLYAFEPMPCNFELLRANIAADPTATAFRMALSDRTGTLHMDVDDVNRGRCRVAEHGCVEVPCTTLDAMEIEHVSLLKVDVEGHQQKVLLGAIATIERDHPAIVIEDEDDSGAQVLGVLGYELAASWPGANHLWVWA